MKKMKDRKYKAINNLLKVVLFLVVITFFYCQNLEKPQVPKNLISKDKITSILTDVYISNAARSVNNNLIMTVGLKLDSIIYDNYDIDSIQFVESNAYYSSDLKVYSKIINDIENRLTILFHKKDSSYQLLKKERADTISINIDSLKTLVDPVFDNATDSIQLKSLK